jgi:limonene 1,2-monooxygenase
MELEALQLERLADAVELRRAAAKTLKGFCATYLAHHSPQMPSDFFDEMAEYLVASGIACIGTPDDCIRHFERLWRGSNGGFGGVLLLAHNWADWPATKKSYELMARYVHPQFQRNANELRQWSYDDAKAKYASAGDQSRAAVQAAIDKHQARKG